MLSKQDPCLLSRVNEPGFLQASTVRTRSLCKGFPVALKRINVSDCVASLVPAPELKFSGLQPESITTAFADTSTGRFYKGAVLKQDRFISFCTITIPKRQGNGTCLSWITQHATTYSHGKLKPAWKNQFRALRMLSGPLASNL